MKLKLHITLNISKKVMDRREAHAIFQLPTISKAMSSRIAIISLEDLKTQLPDKVYP